MTAIASFLEETTKNKLGYEDKPWEVPQRLFKNLNTLCILNNVPMKTNAGRIQKVKIHLVDQKLKKDYGLHEAKPIVKDDRLYLSLRYSNKAITLHPGEVLWPDGKIWCSFPRKGEVLMDAALVFGEEVQAL
jgi:hypothetical protein